MTALRTVPEHRFSVSDVVAGVSVALVAIPQSLAYADLAGLPGYHGLYAVALPLVAAAFFASSPYLQTGPVATTSLLTFGALVPAALPGTSDFVRQAALLALVVGVVRMGIGVLRLGWVSYLMSRPMLDGFMSGAAILIVLSQLPGALGAAAPDGGVMSRAAWTLAHPGAWEGESIALAAFTVVAIHGGRRLDARVPGVLIAAALGLLFSVLSGYEGPRVGAIPSGFPPVSLDLPWRSLPSLVLPGTVIAMVGFAEAASISRSFASEDRERWEANREFVSQGVANFVSGLSGGFPVGGSFARSSLNRLSGAASRWSGLVTGATVLLFLPVAGMLAPLPRAVLAGIVISAVMGLFRPRPLLRLWRHSRPQAVVGWATFGLTLTLAPHVEDAVLFGVLLAGTVHLWRELTLDVRSRREGKTLHLAPTGVLWFGSAHALDDLVLEQLAVEKDVDCVRLDCRGLGRIDLTGAYTLIELVEHLRAAGLDVRLEDVPAHARRALDAAGLTEETTA